MGVKQEIVWKFIWGKVVNQNGTIHGPWHARRTISGLLFSNCLTEHALCRNTRYPDVNNLCERCLVQIAADRLLHPEKYQ